MDLNTLGAEDRVIIDKDVVLRRGDTGAAVTELQLQLKAAGYVLKVDGDFGSTTERLVREVQGRHGLVNDGVAGPKTFDALRGVPQTKPRLTQADLKWAANELGASLSSVMAVNEVESRGRGFLNDGMPVILYERHIMARTLPDYHIDPAPYIKSHPGLVNTARGGYAGGAKEHTRLANAKKICVEAALESASWGAYQIMGFHWDTLGYPSVSAFVAEMCKGERQHLEAFVRFVKKQPKLLAALRAKDWPTFARIYNGPAYKTNQYDVKLAAADKRFSEYA